jgi:hypothetical protein
MAKPLSLLERWTPEALKLPSDDLKISTPLHVLRAEAVDVAKFHEKYYATVKAAGGQPDRPGLDSVNDPRRGLHKKTAEDLLSLRDAVEQANTQYFMAATPSIAAPMERARFLLAELSSVLEFLFDDGVEDERDAQLDAVEASHADAPNSMDAHAAALDDYASLADSYRKEVDGLGGFELKLIDEARAVAAQLRDRPATPVNKTEEAAKALALRNRLATLLSIRMGFLRGAARFVFRHHPEIVREATSAYERRRRAASRRKAMKKEPA